MRGHANAQLDYIAVGVVGTTFKLKIFTHTHIHTTQLISVVSLVVRDNIILRFNSSGSVIIIRIKGPVIFTNV